MTVMGLTILTVLLSLTPDDTVNLGSGTKLQFIGHSSFLFVTPSGTRIIIDPYRNSLWSHWFDYKFPQLSADLVLVSHAHFDHSAVERVKGSPIVIDLPGTYNSSDIKIRAINGRHAHSEKYGKNNIIFIIEIEGVRYCYWGDNDHRITESLKDQIGTIDVLIIPIDDSEHVLTRREAELVINSLTPKVVIPMHYFNDGLTSTCSPLKGIENWLKGQKHIKRISKKGIRISSVIMPEHQETWIIDPFIASSSHRELLSILSPCILKLKGVWIIFIMYLLIGILISLFTPMWINHYWVELSYIKIFSVWI